MLSRSLPPLARSVLWALAWVILLPAGAYGIATGNLTLAVIAGPLGLLALYGAVAKRVCPQCQMVHIRLGGGPRLGHCTRCGAALDPSENTETPDTTCTENPSNPSSHGGITRP